MAAELERVLKLYPPRQVSAPPSSSASATVLSWDEEAGSFRWRYYSAGDYDQNGEVGVSDLTPLGVHFGKSSGGGPFDQATVESVVDGDSNGLIGVSDVTPIGQNFGVKCQGYRLYHSVDEADVPAEAGEANGAGTQLVAELALSAATGTPAERRQFSHSPAETPSEGYYWVRPFDGEQLGTPSNAWLLGAANQAPIAVLRAAPTSGLVPLTVELLGIFSADLDGEIVKYEWDFDGPISGEEWLDTEDEGYVEHTYSEEGAYLATMRVTDDLGATDTATELIVVHEPTPPRAELDYVQFSTDTPSHVLFDASPSVDDDGLIVRYEWDFDDDGEFEYDGGAEPTADFYYWVPDTYDTTVRVTDDDGLSDTAHRAVVVTEGAAWQVTTIREDEYADFEGPNLAYALLLEVAGSPAVLFGHRVDGGPEEPTYIRALSSAGDEWGDPIMLGEELVGGSSVLPGFAIVDGNPAVAGWRHYSRALDGEGVSWPQPQLYSEDQRRTTAILEVGGRPGIADQSGFYLAGDAAGTSWEQVFSFYYFWLDSDKLWCAPVGGKPAIVVPLAADDLLVYAGADDDEGTSWRVPTVVAQVGSRQYAGTAALIDAGGHPAVAYVNTLFATIEYRRALDPQGTAWGDTLILHQLGDFWPSMTVFDGRPAVVYTDLLSAKLYFRAANDSAGQSWGFPLSVDAVAADNEGAYHPLTLAAVNGRLAVAFRVTVQDGEPGERLLLKYAQYR